MYTYTPYSNGKLEDLTAVWSGSPSESSSSKSFLKRQMFVTSIGNPSPEKHDLGMLPMTPLLLCCLGIQISWVMIVAKRFLYHNQYSPSFCAQKHLPRWGSVFLSLLGGLHVLRWHGTEHQNPSPTVIQLSPHQATPHWPIAWTRSHRGQGVQGHQVKTTTEIFQGLLGGTSSRR